MRWAKAGAVLCLVVSISGACGGGDDPEDADDTGAGAARTTTSTTAGGGSGAASGGPGEEDVWRTTAMPYRTRVGETFTLECPPDGEPGSVWGVETYTADSSICTAAVHVGLITFEEGGEVEYEIAAGLDEYDAASANDVLSNRYGRFDGSFTFPKAASGSFTLGPETWQRKATEYRGTIGEKVTLDCAAGGPLGSVWGTRTYTDDSSVCSAAVHAGLITVAKGGKVTMTVAEGRQTYEGTEANGVTSSDYGAYAGSFTFPEDQPDG